MSVARVTEIISASGAGTAGSRGHGRSALHPQRVGISPPERIPGPLQQPTSRLPGLGEPAQNLLDLLGPPRAFERRRCHGPGAT
jgi:hypothetical protein